MSGTTSEPEGAAKPGRRATVDEASTLRTVLNLWPYIWPADRPDLKNRVVMALGMLLLGKIVTVLVPYSFKWATDALTGELDAGGLGLPVWAVTPMMLVAAYVVGRMLMIAFNQVRDALFARVGQHAVRQLAYKTFIHMHELSLRFHLRRRTGGLSRIIERGVKGIETIVRFTILNAIPTALEFALMAAVIAYQFSWSYVGVIAVTVWLYVWFTVRASDWRINIRKVMNDSDTDANSKAIDSLLNYETVKYFNNERMEAARFDVSMERYEGAAVKTWTSLAWLNMGQTVIFTLGMGACMALSARAVMAGEQTIGDFVMINALLMQLSIPLNMIGYIYRELRQGLIDIADMFDLLSVEAEIVDAPAAAPLVVDGGTIRFEDVHFAYDPERQILKGVSFEVPSGHTVAIVGPSGAGKSTISRLIFRFYDVTSGAITIDGQDLREVQQETLRARIGMVPQDTVLFNDTIRYNVRYGRPSANDGEVEEAARMAQIAGFIESLPHGFDTEVGERGLKLSGGEKQRVAIARTLLKAPPILILDEATSALDTQTEREIQSALDVVSKNRTTLVIAHRLSTVVGADQILVLEAGRIVERGTHAELLAKDGLYASMWARQREATEAEERLRQVQEADGDFIVRRGPKAEEVVE
ncbi:ATP-binding cassette subfamily B protein [Breoghania corrubedonensis]|uniref:ATP-binding cassette subfamily B protein n=1 Tax=Breoghania corrubedonensis TaxID=665038 RepID=A0A2T5VB12_9HYPH|nr:ABC transporter ATP-binding protein/permease [Breoghania corrubedonensis]PTW60943.1 ATP-binding cassette subfamily B protein [Breoghania corrubedonensis]